MCVCSLIFRKTCCLHSFPLNKLFPGPGLGLLLHTLWFCMYEKGTGQILIPYSVSSYTCCELSFKFIFPALSSQVNSRLSIPRPKPPSFLFLIWVMTPLFSVVQAKTKDSFFIYPFPFCHTFSYSASPSIFTFEIYPKSSPFSPPPPAPCWSGHHHYLPGFIAIIS